MSPNTPPKALAQVAREFVDIPNALTALDGTPGATSPVELRQLITEHAWALTKALSQEAMTNAHDSIAESWGTRAVAQGCGKESSERFKTAQGHFFAGAMCALDALGLTGADAIPPRWYIAIIRGEAVKPRPVSWEHTSRFVSVEKACQFYQCTEGEVAAKVASGAITIEPERPRPDARLVSDGARWAFPFRSEG